jgi:hypothetical protein
MYTSELCFIVYYRERRVQKYQMDKIVFRRILGFTFTTRSTLLLEMTITVILIIVVLLLHLILLETIGGGPRFHKFVHILK